MLPVDFPVGRRHGDNESIHVVHYRSPSRFESTWLKPSLSSFLGCWALSCFPRVERRIDRGGALSQAALFPFAAADAELAHLDHCLNDPLAFACIAENPSAAFCTSGGKSDISCTWRI